MSIYRVKYLMNFLMNISYHLGMASILALGGYYVATGRIEVGTVVAVASGLTKINDPWGDLVNWYRQFKVTEAKYALIQAPPVLRLDAGQVAGPQAAGTERGGSSDPQDRREIENASR